MANEDDEWDTGAGEESFVQDKYNKFDSSKVNEGVGMEDKEVIRSADKPQVKPIQLTEQVTLQKPAELPPVLNLPPVASTAKPVSAEPVVLAAAATTTTATSSSTSFTAKLDQEALNVFNDVSKKPFAQQACAFLNAYWAEVGSQADFIFEVVYEKIKYADMHAKGVMYVHLYEEGNELDFNIGLYFYEKLCKEVLEEPAGAKWRNDAKYKPSMPSMMTAIVRKQELREKVDVNFDGKCSLLEILLYQYKDFANPEDFVVRSLANGVEHPEITKARLALEDVSNAIKAYETEKQRLEAEAQGAGVKSLGAKAQLAILNASPLVEKLNQALITAEAALRTASKKFGGVQGGGGSSGALWWMERDLQVKKARYGGRSSQ
ncbi:hypothetical protein BASA81_006915 [Batrachochytrium salamandrivorans]|nr:hypothetical protein BASA81_006915 [Batrachochytrium salamandrivorans]